MVQQKSAESFDGNLQLVAATLKHNVSLDLLVAETGLWASPEAHQLLQAENGTGAFYPGVRRYRSGEKEGMLLDGVLLDSNVYAREAIVRTVGINLVAHSYSACHIWPETCYDPRYHTAVANLVLLPRAIEGLSDYHPEVRKALQYRAYELYSWYPEGKERPELPPTYPQNWRSPAQFTPAIARTIERRRGRWRGAK